MLCLSIDYHKYYQLNIIISLKCLLLRHFLDCKNVCTSLYFSIHHILSEYCFHTPQFSVEDSALAGRAPTKSINKKPALKTKKIENSKEPEFISIT